MQDVLTAAIEQYRRAELLKATNLGYAKLRRNKAARREEKKQREMWDAALADGLGDQ
jgi:hypothetical protein